MTDSVSRLTLIVTGGAVPPELPAPPSIHRLVNRLVDAARDWASSASVISDVIPTTTEEGELRLALLDAIHDLEHAETNMAAPPERTRPLFGDGSA